MESKKLGPQRSASIKILGGTFERRKKRNRGGFWLKETNRGVGGKKKGNGRKDRGKKRKKGRHQNIRLEGGGGGGKKKKQKGK